MIELTQQERKLEKSTAQAHGLLALGLLRTALLPSSPWVVLCTLGAIFAILDIASKVQVGHVAWFLAFILLGTGLTSRGEFWLQILGTVCFIVAYAILGFGIGWETVKGLRKRPSNKSSFEREVG